MTLVGVASDEVDVGNKRTDRALEGFERTLCIPEETIDKVKDFVFGAFKRVIDDPSLMHANCLRSLW